jgi:hypothetical protein
MFNTLDTTELDRITGGGEISTDPTACTPDNPTGQRVYHQSVTNAQPQQAPIGERLEQMWQRSMGPWETFNNLFGGFGGRAPRPPRNLRPLG